MVQRHVCPHADGAPFAQTIDLAVIVGKRGEYVLYGRATRVTFGVMTGFVFRGNVAAPPRIADATVSNLVVSADGFVGHIQVVKDLCTYEGTIGGIRR